jgi:hypothetical protein
MIDLTASEWRTLISLPYADRSEMHPAEVPPAQVCESITFLGEWAKLVVSEMPSGDTVRFSMNDVRNADEARELWIDLSHQEWNYLCGLDYVNDSSEREKHVQRQPSPLDSVPDDSPVH